MVIVRTFSFVKAFSKDAAVARASTRHGQDGDYAPFRDVMAS